MAKFSLNSLIESNKIIYIAPILVLASLLNIFSPIPTKHTFGQLEILGAISIICYDLWLKIPLIYSADKIGKKRIESIICVVVSVFSAMLLFAPLMTWQYFNLFRISDRGTFAKPILIAIATAWLSVSLLFGSAFILMKDRMAAANEAAAQQESSMPTPMGVSQ